MKKLLLLLLLTALSAGCTKSNVCPEFPVPSPHVQEQLDKLAAEDREVWEWGNKLLDLCEQLGTCIPQ